MIDQIMKFNHIKELFEGSEQGLFVVNEKFDIMCYNDKFYNQFVTYEKSDSGCDLDRWIENIHDSDKRVVRKNFKNYIENYKDNLNESLVQRYRIYVKNREVKWIESRTKIIKDETDGKIYIIGIHKDVSHEKYIADMLEDLNYVDDLTGLFNQSKLEKDIVCFTSEGKQGVIIFLNINDFKLINEIYGEALGDRVLVRVAEILKNHRKSVVQIYRLYGDEFVILIDKQMSTAQIHMFVNKLKEDMEKRFFIRHKLVSIKMSYGICKLPMKLNNPFELVQRAKWTMIYAKNNNRNMVAIFNDEIEQSILKEMYVKSDIKVGIKNNEFYLKFQPIVDIKNLKLKSFEALVRWKSSVWGEFNPDEFISVAEDNGDILELGQFVLESACQFVSNVKREHNRDVVVSVNVSVIQLMDRQYVSKVMKTLQKYNVKPSSIIVEVTESHMLESNSVMVKKLQLLDKMGIKIALDDFGTGYSSLNSILILPLSFVKIDRIVMEKVMDRKEIEKFIYSIISFCEQMNLNVICEGIENEDMIKVADKLGSDYLQGFIFAKPLNEKDAINYLLKDATES